MTTNIWPSYARVQTDGYRITWRQPIQRITFDDGMTRQALTGTHLTRVRDVTVWMTDADRPRFLVWVDGLGAVERFVWTDIDGRHLARIVGGRGGIRWTPDAASRGRWWRAEMAIEGGEGGFFGPFFSLAVADQIWLRNVQVTLQLPASLSSPAGLAYTLTPPPPAGMVLDAGARTLSGTPTAVQQPAEYTWRATDSAGFTDTVTFNIGIGVSIWDAVNAPLGDASHVYFRSRWDGPTGVTIATPFPDAPHREALQIAWIDGARRAGNVAPAMLFGGVDPVPTLYFDEVVVEHPQNVRPDEVTNKINQKTTWQTRESGAIPQRLPTGLVVVEPESWGWGYRLRETASAEWQYLNWFRSIALGSNVVPDHFGAIGIRENAAADAAIVDFVRLQAVARLPTSEAEAALVWTGAGSVVDIEHGVTFLGGVRPTPGSG